jgi:anion-transporting  ArsA/GET3 family ATPase
MLDELLERRLVVLSGKGGVGKSAVGLALGLAARERGKRVLLAEIDSPQLDTGPFGGAPVGHDETELRPGLSAINLDPARVMDEYVQSVVRVGALSRRILESPVYRRFFAAAPGLPDLMVLGKLMALEGRREGLSRRPRYDLIVLDAPATGHGLSLLRVPHAASAAIPVGPVGRAARRIQALLRDPERTALAIVAVPEELAVVEAFELYRTATDELGIRTAALILNRCHERRFTRAEEAEVLRLAASPPASGRLERGVPAAAAIEAARRHIRQRKRTQFYRDRLRKKLPVPLVSLPLLHRESLDAEAFEELAARVEAW